MLEKLTALLAAFNDGANKGFWRFQWRDRLGRWAEMGRGVLGKLRLKDGSIVSVRGVFVGGTENPGFGRVLVEGQSDKGIPDGIYKFASGNGETFEGLIPEEDLIRQGLLPEGGAAKKDIFGNSVGERLDKDIQDLETISREDITDEDRKLATETPDERQKAIIEEERAKSPVAKLPAGTESDPDQLAKALEDAGVTPKAETPPSPKVDRATDGWLRGAREEGEPIYWMSYNQGTGKHSLNEGHIIDGYVYKGKYNQFTDQGLEGVGSVDDLIATRKNKNSGLVDIYRGNIPAIEDENGKFRKAETSDIFRIEREQDAAKAAQPPTPPPSDKVAPAAPPAGPPSDGGEKFLPAPPEPGAPAEPSKAEIPPAPSALDGLDPYTRGVVSNIIDGAQGQTPKQINKSLKKLHDLASKPDSNRDGLKVAIDELSKLVTDKGGVPFVPGGEDENNFGFKETTDDFDKQNGQQRWEKDYEGGQTLLEVVKGDDGTYEAIAYSGNDNGAWAREDLLPVTDGKGIFKEADKLINDNIEAEAKNDALVEKAIQDAMDGKPVSADEIIKKSSPTPVGRGGFNFEEDEEQPATAPKTSKSKKKPETETTSPATAKGPVKQEPITPEELDALAPAESYEKFFGFLPSVEQTRILNSIIVAKKKTAVRAGAGAGKTTTYIGLCKALMELDPNARIALLQLNRTNADEAAKLVPSNTISNTIDAYFGRPHIVNMAAGKTGTMRGSANDPHVTRYMSRESWHISGAKDLGNHFLMDEMNIGGENYDISKVAGLVSNAVELFCRSTDQKIGPQHFNVKTKAKKATKTEKAVESEDVDIPDEQMKKLLSYANAYWEDLNHIPIWDERVSFTKKDGTPGKKFAKGVTAINPTHAFKMWALTDPDLSKLKAGDGKPITHLLLDEAQDTNAVFEKVIKDNIDRGTAPLIAMVGDRAQSIYKFRGSRDALTTFAEKRAGASLTLTTTRRFGEDLLPAANGFLNLLAEDYRLKSEIAGGEILDSEDLEAIPDFKGNTAIQTRTNAEVFNQIEKLDQLGYTVGVTDKMYDDLTQATAHLEWLGQDWNSRPKKPSGFSSDFAGMNSLKDLIQAAEIDPKSRPGFWWRLIQEDPEAKIKRLKDLAAKVTVKRDQIDVNKITNLDATDGQAGDFNGVKWAIEGDSIILSGDVFAKIPGREDRNFRQAVIGQKAKGSTAAIEPEIKLPDGTTPQWRTVKVGNDWLNKIVVPDDRERGEYLNSLASLFMDNTKDAVIPDVMVSTVHRYKGLEQDNIIIAPDFAIPELDENGKILIPNAEELNLAYTAVTRARKRIFYGPLAYGLEYSGEDGMRKANKDLERESEFGMDLVRSEAEAQAAITARRNNPTKSALKSGQGQSFAGGFKFYEDEETSSVLEDLVKNNPYVTTTVPVSRSTTPNGGGKKIVDGWAIGQNGTYTARINGTTWNIRENRDGTITARPRTNEGKLGSFKFNDWDQLENNFPGLQEQASKANRDVLKDKVSAFDKDGQIAKAIDNGADPADITDMISKSDDFADAIENGDVNFVSLFVALDNAGSSKLNRPNPKTAKPEDPKAKKATKTTAEVASALYTEFGNPADDRKEIDIFEKPGSLERLLRQKGDGSVETTVSKLVKEAGGRVNPDGSVTLYKKVHTETAGPANGQDVELEVRWTGNKASSGTISYIITDMEDGSQDEYYDFSPTHSLSRIFSTLDRRLNTYFLRDPESLPSNLNPDTYGGIRGAVNAMRTGFRQTTARKGIGGLTGFLQDPSASDTNVKLRSPREHAAIALNGRDSRLNNSDQNWHTIQRKGIASIFDAVDMGERDGAIAAVRRYLNDIPNTPAAQGVAKDYIRSSVKSKFPDISPNKLEAMLEDIFDGVNSSDPVPTGAVKVPHVSKNGVQIKPKQKVRWKNNIDGEVVGEVVETLTVDNPDGGRYAYRDFVFVKFKSGEVTKLNAKNMSVVDDATPVTNYSPWVRNNDLKIKRAEQAGLTYDTNTGEYYNKETVVDIADFANERYASSIEDGEQKPINDIKSGDVIYDENGDAYGRVAKIKSGKKDGVKVYKVQFDPQDNQEDLFFDDNEQISVPKPRQSVASQPKTTSNKAIAKAAADLGLAPSADGTSTKKKIAAHPATKNPDTNTSIKGSNNKKAVKPTKEAEEVLDKQLEIGKQAWDMTEPRIIEELNAMGYNIKPGTKYEDLDKNIAEEYDKKIKANSKAKQDLDEFVEATKAGIKGDKDVSDLIEKMKAEGLADAQGEIKFKDLAARLKAAGLEDYSYEIRGLGSDGESDLWSGLAAYKTLTTPDLKTKSARLWKARAEKQADTNKARDNKSKFTKDLKTATKDATLKTLKDLGVSFNNVSLDEFEGNIISVQDNQPLDAFSSFKSARALRAAFEHMPANKIRQLAKYLKDNNAKLEVISGVKRGHFTPKPNGNLEITLSTAKGTQANDSTALHELQHFLDKVDPNSNTLAHTWLHRRAMGEDGNLRPIMTWGKGETGFAIADLQSPYTTRRYERGDLILNPNFDGNEVNSTIMEDLFLDAGSVSRPDGQFAIVKRMVPKISRKTKKPVIGPDGNPLLVPQYDWVFDPFYDPKSDKWYADSSMKEELDVRDFYGRKKEDGLDRNVKHYGMGMILMMNDWSATEGLDTNLGTSGKKGK